MTLGIRPEDIVPEGHGTRPELGADFSAPVSFAEMLGNESLLFADLGDTEIVARMQHPRALEPNQTVRFRIDGTRVHYSTSRPRIRCSGNWPANNAQGRETCRY